MSKKKRKNDNDQPDEEHEASVLPAREVMSLLSPGSTSVPGLGGLLGSDPTAGAGTADPTAGAGTGDPSAGAGPAPAGLTDLASGAAQHAADGQQADQPSVSDQPQSLSTES